MAKPRDVPGLTRQTAYRLAAAATIRVRAEELFDYADGVLDTADIERVHDMRVATRRLRAALEIFAPCFERRAYKRALREVKALADALGARRDPDVQLAALQAIAAKAGEAEGPGIELLAARLRDEQATGNDRLAAALAAAQEADLRGRLVALAGTAERPEDGA